MSAADKLSTEEKLILFISVFISLLIVAIGVCVISHYTGIELT